MRSTMRKNGFIPLILALSLSPVRGQQPPQNPASKWPTAPVPPLQQQKAPAIDADDVVRITTNLVQIDTVVTKNNKQISDLTAQDFEIFEDGKPQPITNFSYIWTVPKTTDAGSGDLPAAVADKSAPPVPPAPVRADESHRTIALVIDDLGIAMENTSAIRRQLRKFIEEQMLPNDLVAIIRTGGEVGALQQFTNDKRILFRAIENVRWSQNSRVGISTFVDYGADASPRGGENGVGLSGHRETSDTYNATLRALRFIMLGMRDIPGRKSMVVFSEDLPTDTPDYALPSGPISAQQPAQGAEPGLRGGQRSISIGAALQRLAELAIRSSIVIYGVDTRGLVPFGPTAATNVHPMLSPTGTQPFAAMSFQSHILQDTRTGQDLLTKETGGFLVKNSNDFGLKRIAQDQAGYYLIGYRPSGDTFNRRFHHIDVKVKRPGLTVRTRSGFFGMTDEETRPMQLSNMDRINMALMSPFGAADIEVHLTALFADVPRIGSMLRSLIHFPATSLKFSDGPAGAHLASFNLAAVVFADNGTILQHVTESRTIRVSQKDYDRVLRQGLAYRVDVPISKSGAYQFRVAVRDEGSSLIGTARQFVEVPELKKHDLTLSGITVSGDGANAEVSDRLGAVTNISSPAIRRFTSGSNLWFAFFVYNAQLDKASQVSTLSAQTKIFRDGQVVYAGSPKQLDPNGQPDLKRITAGGGVNLGTSLEPGEYQLQIVVTELSAKGKPRTASQWIDFEIVK